MGHKFQSIIITICIILCTLCISRVTADVSEEIIGNVRVQMISPIVVRIEEKHSSLGKFEDRKTLMVVNRDNWDEVQYTKETSGNTTILKTANYEARIPNNGSSISGAEVYRGSTRLFQYSSRPAGNKLYPAPRNLNGAYVISDYPRCIPPAWGCTPMPDGALDPSDPTYPYNGWDYRYRDANDVYVFVEIGTGFEGYREIRKDFLKLTGPIQLPPLYFNGFISSRWWRYTTAEFIEIVETFREKNVPLDILVCDTDWRDGDMSYNYHPQYFQNQANAQSFFKAVHDMNCKIMFNDHPVGEGDDYPKYWNGHTSKYDDGLDLWWYDRNWTGVISSPVAGVDRELWGMMMFYDISERHRPNLRNVSMGMKSGGNNETANPVTAILPGLHRYPIWWTGDTHCYWSALQENVQCIVNDAVTMLPWIGHDIAGFREQNPGDELYTRWMEFGALSPSMRIHGTAYGPDLMRYPWQFTAQTQEIVTRYMYLRYRLLPTFYTHGSITCWEGVPICKRCDLEYTESQAQSDLQYIYLNDILITPCVSEGSTMNSGRDVNVWIPPGDWFDAWTGKKETGPKNMTVNSKLWHVPMFIRRGSIFMLGPDVEYVEEKPWNPLVLDVFPPASGKTSRFLYEDDFLSRKYLEGEHGRTDLSVEKQAGGIVVNIGAITGNYTGKLTSRAWVVRLHLDAPHSNQKVRVDGNEVAIGTAWNQGNQAEARQHDQTPFPATITASNFPLPFQGTGAKPGPDAPGPVIEVWVPSGSTSSGRLITYGEVTGIGELGNPKTIHDMFQVLHRNFKSGAINVRFAVPAKESLNERRHVSIKIYNLNGKLIQEIVDRQYTAGYHTVSVDDMKLGNGMYLARLVIDGHINSTTSFMVVQ